MASGAQAEQEIAAASGMPLVTVSQTARVLREAKRDLWLSTGRGRRSGDVSLTHLVNLVIAIAAGPPTPAVENVEKYGALATNGAMNSTLIDLNKALAAGETSF